MKEIIRAQTPYEAVQKARFKVGDTIEVMVWEVRATRIGEGVTDVRFEVEYELKPLDEAKKELE